ncbi:hypothetical protein QAD02_022765 [Eretmocerus hayati]|uniref:Uncharacterized protein n=1 Tax=Eretmocerus hayati TaxID=131215 RepID=A0ACC2PVL0_9HYME|nr:hypothetical protein QAD02_022765 [Eretmocerus hayati]
MTSVNSKPDKCAFLGKTYSHKTFIETVRKDQILEKIGGKKCIESSFLKGTKKITELKIPNPSDAKAFFGSLLKILDDNYKISITEASDLLMVLALYSQYLGFYHYYKMYASDPEGTVEVLPEAELVGDKYQPQTHLDAKRERNVSAWPSAYVNFFHCEERFVVRNTEVKGVGRYATDTPVNLLKRVSEEIKVYYHYLENREDKATGELPGACAEHQFDLRFIPMSSAEIPQLSAERWPKVRDAMGLPDDMEVGEMACLELCVTYILYIVKCFNSMSHIPHEWKRLIDNFAQLTFTLDAKTIKVPSMQVLDGLSMFMSAHHRIRNLTEEFSET